MSTFGTYAFVIMGCLFLVNSIVVGLLAMLHRWRCIPVTAEVIGLRETTTSDDAPASAPIFRILDGEHCGTTWQSWASSSPDLHQPGDIVCATYDPRTGVIQSGSVRRSGTIFAFAMLAAAIACFSIAAFY